MGVDRKKYFRHSRAVTKSKRWPALRVQVLRRDDYRCKSCGSKRHLQVDHVRPVREAPELSYAVTNLQTLCRRCHSAKTRIEVHGAPDPEKVRWRDLIMSM